MGPSRSGSEPGADRAWAKATRRAMAIVAARAIHFAVAIQALGALLFVWIIDHAPASADGAAKDRARRWLVRAAALSAAAALVSGIAWLVLQVADMSGHSVVDVWTSGAIGTLLLQTRAGVVWWVRFALAVALIVDLGVIAWGRSSRAAVAVGLALAAASFISGAWLSHAAADPGPYGSMHLAVHAAHMLGAALWLGGFIPLAMLLSRARSGDAVDMMLARHASVWFGNIALCA